MRSLAQQLLEVADPSIVVPTCRNIAESVDLNAREKEDLAAEAESLSAQITSLASSLQHPDDEPDLYRSLAALWLELRFAWQRHNMVANYDTIGTGSCAPIVLARASTASFFLQRIEALLAREHLDKLGDTAVELLDSVRTDVDSGNLGVAA